GGRFEVGMSLRVRGFRLLQVSFGDGAVSVKILGAIEELVRKFVSVAGFDISGAHEGIVRAGDQEKWLALMNDLAGSGENFMNRAAEGTKDRGSLKCVIVYGAGV